MIYCYMRISTHSQQCDRQELMMEELKIPKENRFQEIISGTVKSSKRPEFEKMLEVLQQGDTIYFESLSRLGRSTVDLIDTVNLLTKKYKVKLIFLKESLTINPEGHGLDAVSNLFFTIMAAMAQFERDLTSQRTREGLAAKKAMGVKLGRKFCELDDEEMFNQFYEDWKSGWSYDELMVKYEKSRPTISKYVKRCKEIFYKGEE